ncbi:MAG: hypothetical protein WC422_01230 [Candidatus Paceibacterota bacterium]
MYYDANGADYISTPSFAIPNTGILTIEAWMKSQLYTGQQTMISYGGQDAVNGSVLMRRYTSTDNF